MFPLLLLLLNLLLLVHLGLRLLLLLPPLLNLSLKSQLAAFLLAKLIPLSIDLLHRLLLILSRILIVTVSVGFGAIIVVLGGAFK